MPSADPSPEAVVAVISFERSGEPNRVVLNLAPDGQPPLPLLLDTGSTHSVVTPMFARMFELGDFEGNSVLSRPTRLGRPLELRIDRGDRAARSGLEYGLLGADFLDGYVVEIDFAGQRVRFLDPERYAVPASVDAEDEAVVALDLEASRPFAEIGANGRVVRALVDTGVHDPLVVSHLAAARLGIAVQVLADFGVFATPGGPMPVDLFETDQLHFAGFGFATTPVSVVSDGWENLGTGADSVIGYDTLRQFTVRIDYPRARMWLRRRSQAVTFMGMDYASSRLVGVLVMRRPSFYEVIGVLPGTAAERLGLLPGDALPQLGRDVDLEQTLEQIAAGGPLRVGRESPFGTRMWVTLPSPEASTPSR